MYFAHQIKTAFITLVTMMLFLSSAHADIKLPDPQTTGGMGIFDTLKKRASTAGGGFPEGKISDETLSTILWSASGLNRGQKGWTVPMAQGREPYVKIYVSGQQGTFLYDWRYHQLIAVNDQDLRGQLGLQAFTRRAYYSLLFVLDSEALSALSDQQKALEFGYVAVGAMTQNIYLASAALKLSTRYIDSIKRDVIQSALHLTPNDQPVALMLLSK